jgi:hypothetical protein
VLNHIWNFFQRLIFRFDLKDGRLNAAGGVFLGMRKELYGRTSRVDSDSDDLGMSVGLDVPGEGDWGRGGRDVAGIRVPISASSRRFG